MSLLIEDIAKKAGVSPATISRVVNNRNGVSDKKAEEIRAILQELNYKPVRKRKNKFESVKKNDSYNIAVVTLGKGYLKHPELFVRYLNGINSALVSHKSNMMLVSASVEDFPQSIVEGKIDGVLVAGDSTDAKVLRVLRAMPCIWLTSHADIDGDKILTGNEEVGRLAAGYLINKGYKNLAFFNPVPKYSIAINRCSAFTNAAEQQDVKITKILGDCTNKNLLTDLEDDELKLILNKMADDYYKLDNRPIGLFVPSDMVTAMLQPILISKGLTANKDFVIVSSDNEQSFLRGLKPRPATIDLGHELMGGQAVEQLIWRIRNNDSHQDRRLSMSIQPKIIEGELDN